MIYTVGNTDSYYQGLQEARTSGKLLLKMGRQFKNGAVVYIGGTVFQTIKQAWEYLDELQYENYSVFKVDADWETDTYIPDDYRGENQRLLLRDARIVVGCPREINEEIRISDEVEVTEKKPMTGLFCDFPETKEGKYLVQRRDGTVPKWPWFVLAASDPIAEVALRAYAAEVMAILTTDSEEVNCLGLTLGFHNGLLKIADDFLKWRQQNGQGDPGMGRHRVDNPEIVAKMRQGNGS